MWIVFETLAGYSGVEFTIGKGEFMTEADHVDTGAVFEVHPHITGSRTKDLANAAIDVVGTNLHHPRASEQAGVPRCHCGEKTELLGMTH